MADTSEMPTEARDRIERVRKGALTIEVTGPDGTPLPGRRIRLEQTNSDFLFGCNFFGLAPDDESDRQLLYRMRFRDLLNFATLPFYWGGYEREPGQTQEGKLRAMARWCAEHGLVTKGHPLIWHEVYPKWADHQETPALELLEARVRRIVTEFQGLVDTWDVINESTVSEAERWQNGVGTWARDAGTVEIAAEALRWAREAGPEATLLLNDFNVSPAFEAQIEALLAGDRRPDVIGIQSHMHGGEWPLERAWEVCETYGRFGLPLHFTELTVISGDYIPDGTDWSNFRANEWPTTPEGEARQADYAEALYTILFSHPAVEAITWWDLNDGNWMNAPSGLVRADMSVKPAYERLRDLIRKQWRTNVTLETDAEGRATVRAFHGSYAIMAVDDGRAMAFEHKGGPASQAFFALR